MRIFAVLFCMASLFATSALASGYRSAGCGLGSMIIKEDGFVQIFAATTNATSYSQTFGITSGTSNCTGSGGYVKADAEQEMYVSANYDVLTQEMAQGSGEHLTALATVMGCKKPSEFATILKQNYQTNKANSPETMLQSVKKTIAVTPGLKNSCQG